MEETCLLAMRCQMYRRRDSVSGFRRELENLVGAVKGKGTSGRIVRPKVPMCQAGADCPVVAVKRSNARGAKGGICVEISGPTGNGRSLLVSIERFTSGPVSGSG